MKRIILFYVLFRILLFLVALISEKIIGSWDDSTLSYLFYDEKKPIGKFDTLVRYFLSPFLKWDAFYFVHISEQGYEHEKFFAFYPLLPLIMGMVSKSFLSFLLLLLLI
jgi:phosphatidylinositol glycan class V